MLFLIPTPIGNLDDMSFRAVKLLKDVDLILAEDTRNSLRLLNHFGIKNAIESFHAHNEHGKLNSVIEMLQGGKKLALISDAGTPGISDPGFLLVREAVNKGIRLTCLPGPTAIIPALVMSGLPCDKFYFEGFLPHKKGRKTRLEALIEMECTVVLYESPYRIIKLLDQLTEMGCSARAICLTREISKIYEENIRGTVAEVQEQMKGRDQIKGEFVVTLDGKKP
mgnify:CR=1 FL=1|jgi:16S rRNA (cytidine1402-2'-O)-methyltransferase